MGDIVEQARRWFGGRNQRPGAGAVGPVLRECADEIERLRAQVEQLTDERESALAAAAFWRTGNGRAQVAKLADERDALRNKSHEFAGMDRSVGIATPCPTCGRSSLFVGSGGHLTCSRTACTEPSVEDAVRALQAERDALLAAKGELVAALAQIESRSHP